MRIIKRACLLQAEYTCILIKELFDNEPRNIQGILLVMQNIDKRIARHIIKTSLIGKIYYYAMLRNIIIYSYSHNRSNTIKQNKVLKIGTNVLSFFENLGRIVY